MTPNTSVFAGHRDAGSQRPEPHAVSKGDSSRSRGCVHQDPHRCRLHAALGPEDPLVSVGPCSKIPRNRGEATETQSHSKWPGAPEPPPGLIQRRNKERGFLTLAPLSVRLYLRPVSSALLSILSTENGLIAHGPQISSEPSKH